MGGRLLIKGPGGGWALGGGSGPGATAEDVEEGRRREDSLSSRWAVPTHQHFSESQAGLHQHVSRLLSPHPAAASGGDALGDPRGRDLCLGLFRPEALTGPEVMHDPSIWVPSPTLRSPGTSPWPLREGRDLPRGLCLADHEVPPGTSPWPLWEGPHRLLCRPPTASSIVITDMLQLAL